MASLSPGEVETVGAFDWGGLVTAGGSLASSIWGKSTAPQTTIVNPGMPGWVLPIAVGGIGIIAFSIFATQKKRRR